jgi:transcriptional regulator with XRE-family HTH domain
VAAYVVDGWHNGEKYELEFKNVKAFGQKLEMLRKQKRKSLKQMSTEIGWWHWCVEAWENGEGVSLETLYKLVNYFGVSVDYLLSPTMEDYQQLTLF